MRPLQAWLADQGIALPQPAELVAAGIALALALAALAAGWLAGRKLGPQLTRWWDERFGDRAEGLEKRLATILRHGTAALLLAIVANAWPWPPLAVLGLGFALACAAALTIAPALRGINLPRWLAWTVAALLFVAIFGKTLGGLDVVTERLEATGFAVGKRRFTLLAAVTLIITLVALYAGVRLLNKLVGQWIAQARGLDPTQKLLAQKLAGIAIVVAAFFFGVDLLDIDLTTFAVFSGALGLAIGFGLQKTVGNLIAGIILLMDRSIKPGDVIVVGDSFGWVNKIGVRAVSVVTRDGKEHLIPNENLMTQEVENWSFTDRNVRVRIPVGISYESDLKLAQSLMLRAATESPRVLDNPKPNVWLTSYGEYALEHEILVWISDPEGGVGNVKSDVLNRLWFLFREHSIVVPVPRREVILRQGDGLGTAPQRSH